MRLIDADALPRHLLVHYKDIEDAPTIDAVPVVRCKGCKQCDSEYQNPLKEKLGLYGLCESTETMVYSDDFCSYGERKENE